MMSTYESSMVHGCQMAIARFKIIYFGPSGFWTMALQWYAAKFDPFLSLDCAPCPPPWRNPIKGSDQILPSGNPDISYKLTLNMSFQSAGT